MIVGRESGVVSLYDIFRYKPARLSFFFFSLSVSVSHRALRSAFDPSHSSLYSGSGSHVPLAEVVLSSPIRQLAIPETADSILIQALPTPAKRGEKEKEEDMEAPSILSVQVLAWSPPLGMRGGT